MAASWKGRLKSMEIKEFAQKVQTAAQRELGDGAQVSLREIIKNNGIVLQGLVISGEGQNICPTIYLESFLQAYEAGTPLAAIVEKVLEIYRKDTPKEGVDMDFFRDFDRVKDRICYRLINREKNAELLRKVPHREFLDLAVCFHYAYRGEELGEGSILIYNTHLEAWNVAAEQLFSLAEENTRRLFAWECRSMEDALSELSGELGKEEARQAESARMGILSNRSRLYGAACVLYPGLLEELAEENGGDFYILPSSVHEVILLDAGAEQDCGFLRDMIRDVNDTQVEPEEVLSYSLYYYDAKSRTLGICTSEKF